MFADADSHISAGEGLRVIRLPEHYGMLSAILHVVPLRLLDESLAQHEHNHAREKSTIWRRKQSHSIQGQ